MILSDEARRLAAASLSRNTRRSYQRVIDKLTAWIADLHEGGTAPATENSDGDALKTHPGATTIPLLDDSFGKHPPFHRIC